MTEFGAPEKTAAVQSMACLIVKEAVIQLNEDLFYKETHMGKQVLELAKTVDFLSDNFETAAKKIVSDLIQIIAKAENKAAGPVANTDILCNFHTYRCGDSATRACCTMLGIDEQSTCKTFTFFKQYLLRVVLEKLMRECRGEEPESEEEQTVLTVHEEQALRYVVGYIPYALHKKYRSMRSQDAKEMAAFLKDWKKDDDDTTEADSFLQYTSVWISFQNRGGLFHVSDKVYTFFRTMEYMSRKVISAGLKQSENLRDCMFKTICGNTNIQRVWSDMTESLANHL